MLARARAWWAGRSGIERLLVGAGVPVVALAAWWGARQDKAARASSSSAPADSEGGPGLEALPTSSPGILNAGAPGIGADQLGAFADAFTGEIGGLEGQLAELEKQFGDTATERARADAALEARFGDLDERYEGVERAATTARTAAGKAVAAAREANRRAGDKRVSTMPTGSPPQKLTNSGGGRAASIRAVFASERLPPPSAARLAVLVASGRSMADIRAGLEAYKRNRPELGIPV